MPTAEDLYHAQRARLDALEATHIARIRRALLVSVERAISAHEQGATPALAASFVTTAEVVTALQRLYVDCGTGEARITYAYLTEGRKALAPPAVVSGWAGRLRRFITTEGAAAVRGITDTTRRLVRAVLNESAAAGDSIAVAAGKLRARAGELAPARAVNIARTELLSASNYASLMGAQATGLKLEKWWMATKDGRVRPSHSAADGQGAPLQDGFFTVGSYPCRDPGDVLLPASERCRCRCSLGYRVPG